MIGDVRLMRGNIDSNGRKIAVLASEYDGKKYLTKVNVDDELTKDELVVQGPPVGDIALVDDLIIFS